MKIKIKYIPVWIVIGTFLGLIIWAILSDYKLERQGILLTAKTLNWSSGAKMTTSLDYEFSFKGKKIKSGNSFPQLQRLKAFEGKYFPVMYDPQFGGTQLLIEPSDFNRFNLPYPDSLKWVLPYLNN